MQNFSKVVVTRLTRVTGIFKDVTESQYFIIIINECKEMEKIIIVSVILIVDSLK
jgi:hypothetical protein